MLKLRNIIRYSTGKEKIITLAFLIIMLSFVNIINTSALSFKSYNSLSFTFNPTVTITLSPASGGSSNNLLIDNLTTGNSDVSNAINIGVATNTPYGISLDATVGSSSIAAENVTSLNHTGTTNNNKFTSIATNANLASLTTANTWGYATSTNSGSNWSNYNGLPAYNAATPANILDVTPDPYAEPSSGSVQFRIGARAGTSQASGSYTNTINFTAVTKPMTTSYNIIYHDNSGAGSNIPSNQSGTINTDSANVALNSTAPTRSGYDFAGWCTVSTNDDTCTGSIYQAGANYPFSNVGGTVNVDLYAMWVIPKIYMQDLDSTNIATLLPTIGSTATVYDKRDETPYTIGRLKMDTNETTSAYWMLDNLALDITAVDLATLKGNTNATGTTLEYLKGVSSRDATQTPNGNYPTAGVDKTWTSSAKNYYSVPMIAVDSTTSGGCNNAYCVNGGAAGSPWSYDDETSKMINGVASVVQGKIGVYYNYCAASAGSYCYGSGTDGTGAPSSDPNTSTIRDVTEDICPAGWRLPTSSSNGEFATLYSAYGSSYTNFQTALSTPLSGSFNSGRAYSQGNGGFFWSSTWGSTSYGGFMYGLYVSSSRVSPSVTDYRSGGRSVRCLLDS